MYLFHCKPLFYIKRYTGNNRSRSHTPPHWRWAIEDRKRFSGINELHKQDTNENIEMNSKRKRIDDEKDVTNNQKQDRHSRRRERQKDVDHYLTESKSRYKHRRDSSSSNNQRPMIAKHKENDSSNITLNSPSTSSRYSLRAHSPLTTTDQDKRKDSRSHHRHHSPSITDDRHRKKNSQSQQQNSSLDHLSLQHHRHYHATAPPRSSSSRAHSPSPKVDQHEQVQSRARSHRSKTPPLSSQIRSSTAVVDQHQTKSSGSDRQHSQSPSPSSTQVRSPSLMINQNQTKDSRLDHQRPKSPLSSSFRIPSSSSSSIDRREAAEVQLHQQEGSNVVPTNSVPALSTRRRKRWENEEEFNERQLLAQHANLEEELRMIAQTSATQLEPPDHFVDIPQPSQILTTISKSKWDDEDEMYIFLYFDELIFSLIHLVDHQKRRSMFQKKCLICYKKMTQHGQLIKNEIKNHQIIVDEKMNQAMNAIVINIDANTIHHKLVLVDIVIEKIINGNIGEVVEDTHPRDLLVIVIMTNVEVNFQAQTI